MHAWRRLLALFIIAAGVTPTSGGRTLAQQQPMIVALVGGRVYPAPDAEPIENAVVIVRAGRIAAVGPRDTTPIPTAAAAIDCTGFVVMAGFQNSHVHFTPPGWIAEPSADADDITGHLRAMLTRWGFTTVVDTGSDPVTTGELRRRIESGEVKGPRIFTAGLPLYPPNGLPFYLADIPTELLKRLPQPRTPSEAAAAVRNHLDDRDLVKLFVGSLIAPHEVLPMPEGIAVAAAREAHAAKKLVFAHPSNVAGLEVALKAEVDVLAHAIENTVGFTPAHLARMRRQSVALVPTLKLFGGSPRVLDWVRNYAEAGGQILFGTDVGYLKDMDPTAEYVLMAGAGLGYREILAALTTSAAQRFGESGRRGRVAPGLDGDLVVLGSDPARGVRAFADVRYAIRGGQIIYARATP